MIKSSVPETVSIPSLLTPRIYWTKESSQVELKCDSTKLSIWETGKVLRWSVAAVILSGKYNLGNLGIDNLGWSAAAFGETVWCSYCLLRATGEKGLWTVQGVVCLFFLTLPFISSHHVALSTTKTNTRCSPWKKSQDSIPCCAIWAKACVWESTSSGSLDAEISFARK